VRSRALSAASQHLARMIEQDWKISRDRIRILPNPVCVQWICELAASRPREVGGEYLLYFGRLERIKGVHVLSGALPEVFRRRPDLKVVLIGKDCGLREQILSQNHQHASHILLFDAMPQERLFGFIQHAKLVVLPSLSENMSNAGLEAMALARPLIGTLGTAFEEILRDGENGFLVPAGDSHALSAKILDCLAWPDLAQVSRNARQTALHYDISRVTAETVNFFRCAILEARTQ
jgi:glycosyltransferase involved in cell wall biosynthesis